MGQPVIGSLDLDTSSQGSVRRSSNLSGGQKFADALDEGADAVGEIAGNLANVFPGGGGAILSAVSSGLSSVTESGPFGSGSSSLGGSMGGSLGGIGGGGFAGAMGGGGSSAGGIGSNTIQGPMGNITIPKNMTQTKMLQIQAQLQNQTQMMALLSAIINMDHQTAMQIIGNIH